LTNNAQLWFLIFNFIKKPGSSSGRTNIKFSPISNTCPLAAIFGQHITNMNWFDNFLNKPIIKILRIDSEADYEYYQPYAIILILDNETGLLISCSNDGNSIQVSASTLNEIYDDNGIEFNESVLNELKPTDELTKFVGQTIRKINVGLYNDEEVVGGNFIIKQGKYSGIILSTNNNNFTFYNQVGGHLWIDDDSEFPNKGRWTMTQNGC
jgi:hypothetical protein